MTELAVALLVIALLLLIGEAHAPSGILGTLGVAALVGAAFAYREDGHDIPVAVIVAGGVILTGFIIFASRKVLSAQRDEPVRTGWEELVGREAEVREPLDPVGQIWVEGALWTARVGDGEPAIGVGARVQIRSVEGLTLVVGPAPAGEVETPARTG